jgi:gluconolactonase
MLFDIQKTELNAIIRSGAELEPISTGHKLTEGIMWHHKDNYLIFSCMAQGKVFKWTEAEGTTVIKTPSNITNGNFIDPQGLIVSCEHATSRITRMEADGRWIRVLASHYEGKELNSPNDIIVDSKNRIWFTDPMYGRNSPAVGIAREPQLDFKGVFRLDPDGTVTAVAKDFDQPNGLCMEPGEQTLLVNDTPRMHIRRFKVAADGSLSGGDVVATLSGKGTARPDGLKVDEQGRIYCTGPDGIHILTPGGEQLGFLRTPEQCRNFCFGGPDRSELYLATSTTIFRLKTNTRGVKYFG